MILMDLCSMAAKTFLAQWRSLIRLGVRSTDQWPTIAGACVCYARNWARWADIEPNEQEQTLTIRIHRMACPAHDKAIGVLLLELNELSFHHPETGMRMIYTLA